MNPAKTSDAKVATRQATIIAAMATRRRLNGTLREWIGQESERTSVPAPVIESLLRVEMTIRPADVRCVEFLVFVTRLALGHRDSALRMTLGPGQVRAQRVAVEGDGWFKLLRNVLALMSQQATVSHMADILAGSCPKKLAGCDLDAVCRHYNGPLSGPVYRLGVQEVVRRLASSPT